MPGDVVSSPGFFMSNPSIQLRKLQPSDLHFLLQIETDPENLPFSGAEELPTVSELEAYLISEHNILLHDQLRLVIEFESKPVGFVDLFDVDFLLGVTIFFNAKQLGSQLGQLPFVFK